ncbi:MAG TPA: RHS repeat-associated core domain-containing protein [Longimicrobium sp.]
MNLKKTFTLAAALASSGALGAALLGGEPVAPQVSVAEVNPGTAVERDLCLSVSVGPGAASECGDLRLAHALPAVRTLNQARAPVLLYNSQHASPFPAVAAHVTLPSGTAGLSRVVAVLRVNGTPRGQGVWKGSTWPGAGPVRIAVGYDASGDATGPYRYTLEVRAHYGATTTTQTAHGELVVVNRRESRFGAGWWLAGLEQLVMDPSGRPLLWVGGDGSTRRYTVARGDSVWGAPSLDRPDTLKRAGTGWERILPGGVLVRFDAAGNHVATRSRIGYETTFGYASGRLGSVSVPPAGSGLAYTFVYGTDGLLQRVDAPGVQGARRVVLTRSGAELAIQDPDGTRVAFTHADATRRRIVARRNRTGHTTQFRYGESGRIASSRMELAGGDSIVTRLTAVESLGFASATGGGAVDTAQAYALLDGPRTDVLDHTKLWLDRWGAPRRIRDALGRETLLARGDPRFPALVTRVVAPNGLTSEAAYTARGLVDSTVVRDPYGDGRNAVTSYAYTDASWRDFVTRIRLPEGEVTRLGYDPATGNRAWTQPGDDETRRVTFYYNSAGLYSSSCMPSQRSAAGGDCLRAVRDSVEYDTRGNLASVITPLRFRTEYRKDALGRDTLVRAPIDVAGTLHTLQRTVYDEMDRVLETRSVGPATTYAPKQEVLVVNRYDEEGRTRSVTRWSSPDTARIDTVTTSWRYDWAGRQVAELAPGSRVYTTQVSERVCPDPTTDACYDEVRDTTINAELKDSVLYDPAGNVRRSVTRRGHELVMEYDALNRLTRRIIPEVTYPEATAALEGSYPRYSQGLRIPADTVILDYDAAGNLVRADNRDARVSRSYHPDGTLRGDTLRVRTYTGSDFSKHVYGLRLRHDLNGRRIRLWHPEVLAPRSGADSVVYAYDPLGQLARVTDPLGNNFSFHYDADGRQDSVAMQGGVHQVNRYDADGRLARRVKWGANFRGSNQYGATTTLIHSDTLLYDARGKVVAAVTLADSVANSYSGLGMLARMATYAFPRTSSATYSDERIELFTTDGLGNQRTSQLGIVGRVYDYERNTGRLLQTSTNRSNDSFDGYMVDQSLYDAAGNLEWQHRTERVPTYAGNSAGFTVVGLTRQYYGADGKLRVTDKRTNAQPQYVSSRYVGAFEEVRYDALGRRVLLRARRDSAGIPAFSTIERFAWDGDQVLYEMRYPGGDTRPLLEADTTTVNNGTGYKCPPEEVVDGELNCFRNRYSTFYGRVAYTHGAGIDQPLSLIRIGYGQEQALYQPFAVMPHTDWRGVPEKGTSTSGSDIAGTAELDWLTRRGSAFLNSLPPEQPRNWFGNLIGGMRTASGQLYKRNRYYDPQTGRFTQEDPIGLAGGINLYGFANGDPVGYSDPYGLAACPAAPAASGRHSPQLSDCTAEELSKIGGVDEPLIADPINFLPVGRALKFGSWAKGALGNLASRMLSRGATEAGEHIVLGLASHGLERTAASVGGRHLMNDVNWRSTFMAAIGDARTTFTVSLDGLGGSSTYQKVMGAVQRGAAGSGATNWEMAQLYQAGRLGTVNFVETVGGKVANVANPFQ